MKVNISVVQKFIKFLKDYEQNTSETLFKDKSFFKERKRKKTWEKENEQFFLTKIPTNKCRRNEGNVKSPLIYYDTIIAGKTFNLKIVG